MAMDIKALTTREGVVALRGRVSRLTKASLNLVAASNEMQQIFVNEMVNLGPYQSAYNDMLNFARVATLDASGDIESLKNCLSVKADQIEEWLNQQNPSGMTGTTGSSGDAWPSPPVDVKKKVR